MAKRANPNHDEFLAAEYVTGLLPLSERAEFEARLSTNAALKEKVRFWEEKLLPLTNEVATVLPDQKLYAAIETRLFGQATAAPAQWLQSLVFWRSLSFASLAALGLALLLFVNQPHQPQLPAENLVAELSGPQQAVKLAVLYDSQKGEIRFTRVSGAPVSGRDFELWVIAGNNAPVSLGVLPATNKGVIKVSEVLKAKLAGSVLAISDEPVGGSPTGQPTGAVLATGDMNTI